MPIDPHEFAKMLGAEIVGEVPDVGGGPFGMARLAHIMHERLTPSQGERPGRPTNPDWVTRCKVPMSNGTLRRLAQLAETMSTAERKVSPMQVAAQLLEEALVRVNLCEPEPPGTEQAPPAPIKLKPARADKPPYEDRKTGHRRKKA
jgi:hypothetical protein